MSTESNIASAPLKWSLDSFFQNQNGECVGSVGKSYNYVCFIGYKTSLKSIFHLLWTFLKVNKKQRSNILLSLPLYQICSRVHCTHIRLGIHLYTLACTCPALTLFYTPTPLHMHKPFHVNISNAHAFLYKPIIYFLNMLDIVLHKHRLTEWGKDACIPRRKCHF